MTAARGIVMQPDTLQILIERCGLREDETGVWLRYRQYLGKDGKPDRLLWWARDKGAQDTLVEALFRAYFTEGRDIGENKVLAEIAAEVSLSPEQAMRFLQSVEGSDEVLAEEREGRRRGLNGVPFHHQWVSNVLRGATT
jgi:predicted DsbA family dithiol-disulfide isomerase